MPQVALVGCAHIHTPNFVRRMQAREDIDVRSVWDHDAGRAAKNADALNARVVPEPGAVWADPEVEAVVVCSETVRHRELVLPAAEAGKHLFVEKPLGITAGESYEMADAIDRAGVLFQTGYFMRGGPINQFVRGQIAAGALGAVTRVRASNGHGGSLGGWFDMDWRWMTDPAQAGVGGFGDLGTHGLDLMLWLMGDARPVESATASIASATGRYGDVDEYGEGLMRFAGGAIGTLAAGWVDVANPAQLVVSGTEGHALMLNGELFFKSANVEGATGEAPWIELPEQWPHAFELFLDAVSGKPDVPLVTPREAAVRSAVMEALYEGARRREWVSPELR